MNCYRALTVVVLAATVMLANGCGDGLQFAKDERLTIVAPKNLATVDVPVHLRWTSTIAPANGDRYAVFVDHLPVHPGQNLRSMADASCASVRSCVDEAWLNRHFVYVTQRPSLDLEYLPILDPAKGEPEMHRVTIVLVDADWRRVNESAWRVSFELGSHQ